MTKDNDHRKVATHILGTANKVVTTERGGQHGGAEDSFAMIGHLWSVYLANTNRVENGDHPYITVTPKDVAQMMVLLKIARNVHGQLKDDDFVDQAGYTALAAALAGIQAPEAVAVATTKPAAPDPRNTLQAELDRKAEAEATRAIAKAFAPVDLDGTITHKHTEIAK